MSDVTPCSPNPEIKEKIDIFADELRQQAHKIGSHGLSDVEFAESGLLEAAIERIRGQNAATMKEKKHFVSLVLNHMLERRAIANWQEAGAGNRHDLAITLNSGRTAVIELKGCLDGNNTNISDRPAHADEFVTWSLCQQKTSNLRKGVWSGIHTRMGADIVDLGKRHDGLIVWDWLCNSLGRQCPKISFDQKNVTVLGSLNLPPPCIYVFRSTLPSPRNNPSPPIRKLQDVEILMSFHAVFFGKEEEINIVQFQAQMDKANLTRKTTISRNNEVVRSSKFTPIKRR